ncbi:hypothetical protein CEJ86_28085 [Sinorhizobium meliloti]|uniref:Uncharacterized protein n=1 Tax=Rhizobium meliloti TaxID=382 RepID=A0A2J0YV46_RHIML|nr:hypothetical protein CEJ86_28085 [Sinorhizobium meliloti]
MVSLPSYPKRLSLPPLPEIESLPPKPNNTSARLAPVRVSLPRRTSAITLMSSLVLYVFAAAAIFVTATLPPSMKNRRVPYSNPE